MAKILKMRRKTEPEHPNCEITNCWNPSKAKKGGMCAACYSWWHRVAGMSPVVLDLYVAKQERMLTRVNSFPRSRKLHQIHSR